MKFPLERITANLALLGAILICGALIKQYTYYSQFNIEIINYLDTSEIILSNFGIFIGWVGGISIILNFITLKKSEFEAKSTRSKFDFMIILIIVLFSNLFSIEKFCSIKVSTIALYKVIGIISVLILMNLMAWFLYITLNEDELKNHRFRYKFFNEYIVILFLSLYMLINVTSGIYDYHNVFVKNKKSIQFETETGIVRTSNTIYNIGQTKNFTFIYDIMKNQTYVYKNSEIKNLIVINK